MWSGAFWKHAVERMIKTFAQAAAALITGEQLSIWDVDWRMVLGVAALAAIYSILTSIGSAPIGEPGTPSLTQR